MKLLTTTVARVLFGLPFVIFGILHFIFGPNMAGIVPSWVPGGVFWVYVTGICLIAAGGSIISTKLGTLASKLLAVLLCIFILTVHLPGLLGGNQMALPGLLKDLALLGGALTWAGIFENQS